MLRNIVLFLANLVWSTVGMFVIMIPVLVLVLCPLFFTIVPMFCYGLFGITVTHETAHMVLGWVFPILCGIVGWWLSGLFTRWLNR